MQTPYKNFVIADVESNALNSWKLNIFKIVDGSSFYCNNLDLLPPKPKFTFRYLKKGYRNPIGGLFSHMQIRPLTMLWSFEKGTILTPLSKNLALQKHMSLIRLMRRLLLIGTDMIWQLSLGVFVDEDHSKLPTINWLPKLHKRPNKSRFNANCSSCTTTQLSILLTSCPTAIKNHVIKYCTIVYERNGKNLFWSIKNAGEILNI